MQQSFVDHDGLQCGYCTPGQVCSAFGLLAESAEGHPSHVSAHLDGDIDLTDEEIRERMSGNLCLRRLRQHRHRHPGGVAVRPFDYERPSTVD